MIVEGEVFRSTVGKELYRAGPRRESVLFFAPARFKRCMPLAPQPAGTVEAFRSPLQRAYPQGK